MAVFAVAVAAGDIIKYQSFVYGSFVLGIHVRYNNIKYQSFVYGSFVWGIHVRYNKYIYYTIIDFNEVDIRIYLPEKVIIHRGC